MHALLILVSLLPLLSRLSIEVALVAYARIFPKPSSASLTKWETTTCNTNTRPQ